MSWVQVGNRTRIAGILCLVVVAALFSSSTARSATLRVPEEYPDITSAANVAQRGDSILVWRNPNGADYENQQINLRQGVVLRGMEQIYPFTEMQIRDSTINLLEATPTAGVDDTTRVEYFSIYSPPFHESVQVNTPRSSTIDCWFWSSGPQDWTTVRVWKGGLVARNHFAGTGEDNAIEVRQGVTVVAGNTFDGLLITFSLYNQGAPEPATLSFRNNTINSCGEFNVFLRSDSNAEVVNNIFHSSDGITCSGGAVDIRYNDFNLTYSPCPLGVGNISDDPLFCSASCCWAPWVEPNSPCVGTGENGATMGAGGICGVTAVAGGPESPSQRLRLTVDPNPISGAAEFSFEGGIGNPTLEIFDPQGRLVDLLHPLEQRVRWSPARSWPRGVYFARLRGTGVSEAVKFLVIR